MPFSNHGAKIYYETMGSVSGEPLVLIEGLGAQLCGWREEFRQKLVDCGMHVIALDNRDVGMSEKFGGPNDFDGNYTLEDMARDVFGVLDTLELPSAHIVGQSMGGMIAQTMAILNPHHVKSMTLFYTTPAVDGYFQGEFASLLEASIRAPRPSSREQALQEFVMAQMLCASDMYPADPVWMQELAKISYDRGYCPEGAVRQSAAIFRGPDRTSFLKDVQIPAAIIQGRADRAVKVEAALDLGKALKNSEVHVYPGLGHAISQPLWDEFVRIIERTAKRASGA
jgi:pimeloyl-ACP methyl ester carboxylesterase